LKNNSLIVQRDSTICELSFGSAILAIKINRKSIVVVLEEFIYVYDIGNMHLLETIDTCPNPNGNNNYNNNEKKKKKKKKKKKN